MGRYLLRRKAVKLRICVLLLSSIVSYIAANTSSDSRTVQTEQSIQKTPTQIAHGNGNVAVQKSVAYRQLTIPGANRTEVEQYRQQFLMPFGRKWLNAVLTEAEPYRLYVRQQLVEKHMPACLEYLPVVESDYKPTAESKSGAKGMWQFMPNSMEPFLKKNEWIDERLDPWKSTDAALEKLQDNYKMFGDWSLAIAAYNCGAGALSRILKTSKEKSFWYLEEHRLLTGQASEYVPKFIAIADLAMNHEYYGIDLPDFTDSEGKTSQMSAEDFDYVTVLSQISLDRFAEELRIDTKDIKSLNPALIKDITPPHTLYKLRIPQGFKKSALLALRNMGAFADYNDVTYTKYEVVRGDSLWAIARKFKITIDSLCLLNDISAESILPIGKILYIPRKTADK